GPVASPHGLGDGPDPRERADHPRCGGRGHERDERHSYLGHERTCDDGGAVWDERRLPDPRREHVESADEPCEHAHEPRPGYRNPARCHVPGPTRQRHDGRGRLIVSSHDAAWALSDPNSTFRTPASAAWVHGVLKATFVCDPQSIASVAGISADPISGTYTGGVAYTPHRPGGADDEIAPMSAGGTTSSMWTDGQVTMCAGNRAVGLRW